MRASGEHNKCFFYRYKASAHFDHICPKSQCPKLIDKEENLVPVCNEAHYIITNGTNKQIKELPNITRYLEKMSELDFSYYSRFMTNHELW